MAFERTGQFEEAQRRREVFARHIAPPDRTLLPTVAKVVQPEKPRAVDAEIREILMPIMSECDTLRAENADLRGRLTVALLQLDRLRNGEPAPIIFRNATIAEVQRAFCKALAEENYTVDGAPYGLPELRAARRSRSYSWPRHVCIFLTRRLRQGDSLPTIGKAFGQRDHTTIMHACRRAPTYIAGDPMLARVHDRVLAMFVVAE